VTKNLSVMRTDETDRALKILVEAHGDLSSATRWALKIAANMLEYSWLCGFAHRGEVPEMKVYYRKKGEDHDGE
jgi:hypothetical protein